MELLRAPRWLASLNRSQNVRSQKLVVLHAHPVNFSTVATSAIAQRMELRPAPKWLASLNRNQNARSQKLAVLGARPVNISMVATIANAQRTEFRLAPGNCALHRRRHI